MTVLMMLIKLVIAVFFIRFHANSYRLGLNPVLAKLNQITNPLVQPFLRLVPHPRYEIGSLVVALLIAILAAIILTGSLAGGLIVGILQLFAVTWLDVIMYSLIIVVIASWLQTDPRQPVMQIALSCNEWLMAPLRRVIPPLGMIDISPIVAFLGIYFAKYLLAQLTFRLLLSAAHSIVS